MSAVYTPGIGDRPPHNLPLERIAAAVYFTRGRAPQRPLNDTALCAMGKSFTEFRGHGFWVRDTPLECWLRLVTLHLRYRVWIDDAAFRDMRETWLIATSGCTGYVGNAADLDRVLKDDAMVEIAVEASQRALALVKGLGPKLDHRYLTLLGLGTFTTDLDAWKVMQVGEHFIRLLRGELRWEVRSSSPLLPAAELEAGNGGPVVA